MGTLGDSAGLGEPWAVPTGHRVAAASASSPAGAAAQLSHPTSGEGTPCLSGPVGQREEEREERRGLEEWHMPITQSHPTGPSVPALWEPCPAPPWLRGGARKGGPREVAVVTGGAVLQAVGALGAQGQPCGWPEDTPRWDSLRHQAFRETGPVGGDVSKVLEQGDHLLLDVFLREDGQGERCLPEGSVALSLPPPRPNHPARPRLLPPPFPHPMPFPEQLPPSGARLGVSLARRG